LQKKQTELILEQLNMNNNCAVTHDDVNKQEKREDILLGIKARWIVVELIIALAIADLIKQNQLGVEVL